MSATEPQELQITLTDIAHLARVQRPVVSMWRSRSKATDTPFPASTGFHGRQQLFNAHQVTNWLTETGRGNNPSAAEDVAAFASPLGPETRRTHFAALTALLALRCLTDSPLGNQSAADLLDSADECDPDDEFLFTEVHALGQDLLPLAAYADLLTDASYTAAAAFEQLLGDRFRSAPDVAARTSLAPQAVDLMASAAVELTAGGGQPPVFMDDGGSDFLLAVANILGESAAGIMCVGTLDNEAARMARRRLHVQGQSRENLDITNTVPLNRAGLGATVRLAQFPSPVRPLTEAVQVLTAIDNIAMEMNDQASAVILAPAAILTDALLRSPGQRDADAIRSDALRSGRVRAIVRLPQNLRPSMPRQAQALWVMGANHRDVDIAQRWTMVADLSGINLTTDVRQDLVSDLAASMGSREQIRAHSFRFARLVPTRTLLAGTEALTAAVDTAAPAGQLPTSRNVAAAKLVKVEELLASLDSDGFQSPPVQVAAATSPAPAPTTVGQALKDGSAMYLPGHRIAPDHLEKAQSGSAQLHVIGVDELNGNVAFGSRRISQLVFAQEYPQGRLTEPGDVIFATGAQGGAVLDGEGAAVVLYPARILRINGKQPRGLLPAVLAEDLRATRTGQWKQWPLRRVPQEGRAALGRALAAVDAERRRLAVRLQRLDELTAGLADGVAQGSFEVVDSVVTREGTS